MPSWWSKSSSKEGKKNTSKESVSDTFHQKCKIPSDNKPGNRAVGSRRRTSDTISEKGSKSRVVSRSSSPSKQLGRCQSSIDKPQPLPRPGLHPAGIQLSDSGISTSPKTRFNKCAKPSLFRPLLRSSCMRGRPDPADKDEDVVRPSFSSESSIDSDYQADSCQRSPLATDCESGGRTAAGSPSYGVMARHQPVVDMKSRDAINRANQVPPGSVKMRNLSSNMPNLQVPCRGTLYSAPDSSLSSPSRSPMRAFGTEQIINSGFWAGKAYPEGSGHCPSPGSGQNSGHNSMGGDMYGQFFWQPSRNSPEYSPIPSPRMTSPGPSSRVQSGAGTPLHPRAGGSVADDGKQSHRLPLPPVTSPSVPQSPARMENPARLGSRWKKGKLLGNGTFGHVYVGFNSEKGEMCAMKEVTMFSDDAKSKECAKQLGQEIALLSRLRHPNIVQYYGFETVGDKLYIYLEYVSGGSIHKLLQEYGQLGESAIRSYTKQILSGLAYLHSKNTIHRDIKGANILVDPNGRVKLADFGMAKHITGQSCPLSFKGSPYWMAPEVIQNSNSCSFAVDIWSLGCTVLEMATAKPPWSQYEGVAAMFKIGNSKDLPPIPDHLPDDGKDFVKRCLQRNPMRRPTAVQLLDHSFVKRAATLETPVIFPEPFELPSEVGTRAKAQRYGPVRNASKETDRLTSHSPRVSKGKLCSSGTKTSRNISCPVSPMGSPLFRPRSRQNLNEQLSPSPIPSPYTMSGSSTPLTGGGGTIPFRHFNQSVYSQESFANKLKPSQCGTYACNTPSYTSANHDLIRGMHSGSQPFRDFPSTEIEALGNQFARPINREMYDGQSVLSDRANQQLDHAKLGLPSHLNSCSPSRRPMS